MHRLFGYILHERENKSIDQLFNHIFKELNNILIKENEFLQRIENKVTHVDKVEVAPYIQRVGKHTTQKDVACKKDRCQF